MTTTATINSDGKLKLAYGMQKTLLILHILGLKSVGEIWSEVAEEESKDERLRVNSLKVTIENMEKIIGSKLKVQINVEREEGA